MDNQPPAEDNKSIYDVPMDLPGEKPKRKLNLPANKKTLLIGALLLLILIVGAWTVLGGKNEKPSSTTSQQSEQTKQSTNVIDDVPEATSFKTYSDDTIGFTSKYPDTWEVQKNEGGVRFNSPAFSFTATNEESVNGYFRLYIRTGARSQDGKYIGRGLAIKPSEKLTYAEPLVGQRKTTWLSSFGLDKTNNFNFFLIAGNFELKKGESLGPDYGKEAETFIVAGGYSSSELKDDLAMYVVPINYYNQTKAYAQAIAIVKSLQLR